MLTYYEKDDDKESFSVHFQHNVIGNNQEIYLEIIILIIPSLVATDEMIFPCQAAVIVWLSMSFVVSVAVDCGAKLNALEVIDCDTWAISI